MTVDEVIFEIEKERPFFDESGGGVTASGGEPLAQPEFLRDLFKECKRRDIHTTLDTSGYAAAEVFDSVIDFVDLFLFDLKLIDKEKHREYTGVSNELILRNLNALVARKKPTIVRFAVIPGINDSSEDVNNMANYVGSLRGVKKISLLPFHAIAGDKYRRLNIENRMVGVEEPTSGRMESIKKVFENKGLEVEIGG